MAITILTQPAANGIVAAYRPIQFLLNATQSPTGPAIPTPVIYADIYFDGVYYSSLSVTDYDPLVTWLFSLYLYTIDIQDKVQEYLKSKFVRMYEQGNGGKGDMESFDYYSCSIQVKFREGYVDSNGFTQIYGTAPVQGTKTSAPTSGTGTATSNTFYGLNATLTHEDNPDLALHLQEYQDPFQTTYGLSHRPNYMSYINKTIGGGKYWICKEDDDYLFWFANGSTPPWLVSVIVKYKNGTTATVSTPSYPTPTTTPNGYKVYSFNAGIPNLRTMFTTIAWDNVVEYELFVYYVFFQATRQYYYVKQSCCDEHKRIFFLNSLGAWDGLNVEYVKEINKTQSENYQAVGRTIWDGNTSKAFHSVSRSQPKQNDLYEAQCKDYDEKDMYWIKELLGSPRAYIQWSAPGQPKSLLPIVIEDMETTTLKTDDRYEYLLTFKFRLSNERITLRN